MHRVFVYGKLRKGFWRDLLLRDGECMGTAWTRNRFALYRSAMPYVTTKEAVSPIAGEVYRVNEGVLRDLDRFKGHPHWFRREKAAVVFEDGQGCLVWLYCHPRIGGELIPSGDYDPEETPCRIGSDRGEIDKLEKEGGAS